MSVEENDEEELTREKSEKQTFEGKNRNIYLKARLRYAKTFLVKLRDQKALKLVKNLISSCLNLIHRATHTINLSHIL